MLSKNPVFTTIPSANQAFANFLCVYFSGNSAKMFAVRAGSAESASGGTLVKVKKYIKHPKNGRTAFDYDFALLKLQEPLEFDDQIQPIALPDEQLDIPDDALVEISGWGKNQEIFHR